MPTLWWFQAQDAGVCPALVIACLASRAVDPRYITKLLHWAYPFAQRAEDSWLWERGRLAVRLGGRREGFRIIYGILHRSKGKGIVPTPFPRINVSKTGAAFN